MNEIDGEGRFLDSFREYHEENKENSFEYLTKEELKSTLTGHMGSLPAASTGRERLIGNQNIIHPDL